MKIHIYASCGLWKSSINHGWGFLVDEGKGGRLLTLDTSSSFEKLKVMVCEDFGIDANMVSIELSYLPSDLINSIDSPPVIITNDRQASNFLTYVKIKGSTRLCVTMKSPNLAEEGTESPNRESVSMESDDSADMESEEDVEVHDSDDDKRCKKEKSNENSLRFALVDVVKKGQHFSSKMLLKAAFELCAMKHNFDYVVAKSDKKVWYVRCADDDCSWRVRAEGLTGSSYFIIKKYVPEHSCAPSNRNGSVRTASAKTVATLIMHKYETAKEGPKSNDIIQYMRMEHGVEISYSLAWDAREFAINAVKGIPEKGYEKIPKYLHMMKEANPGSHTAYESDRKGRFRFLFISFGQSVRGFYAAIRKVIVVDGTFLKSKYKGVLLVATALDGNSNLYPIAFGVVDSENDLAWEWFMRQLNVVIVDEHSLAFVSDRNSSIAKAIARVYPQSHHGICIHHLLNNVVTNYSGKGMAGLVAKASKAYRAADFRKLFTAIFSISPEIGKYLIDADVRKWARCQFPGYRYDIRTNNPAESINSALRTPREFPVIPLLDSIREMMTRWFFKRRTLSSKHSKPLTIAVEKKIDRRIEKGKTFKVFPVSDFRFLVQGDSFDCMVDLVRRTCSCGKFDLIKIPCRHAIKAGFSVGIKAHALTDDMYTTATWQSAYEESINPIGVPEDSWKVPSAVEESKVLPPKSRRAAGRRKKRRYETAEDKIRASQGSEGSKVRKCSRCGNGGHNRRTCDRAI
ncbi:uncharacterized protein LOC108815508 [Raphanus sativus]|uniref:Uncharacterized protein LOC108815508 n=1 Tax=Raphanus sativus TaxID=3726 RepID=A0A6J0K6I6_RAPSA|nr:uncharacterized protein LOC108815508 [Raphanus sativus]